LFNQKWIRLAQLQVFGESIKTEPCKPSRVNVICVPPYPLAMWHEELSLSGHQYLNGSGVYNMYLCTSKPVKCYTYKPSSDFSIHFPKSSIKSFIHSFPTNSLNQIWPRVGTQPSEQVEYLAPGSLLSVSRMSGTAISKPRVWINGQLQSLHNR